MPSKELHANTKTLPAEQARPPYRVLIVEEDTSLCQNAQKALLGSTQRSDVVIANSGQDGLRLANTFKPDLILANPALQTLGGTAFLQAIRSDENLCTIPVISICTRPEHEAGSPSEDADDYLIKPFSDRELLARVTAQVKITALRKESLENAQANNSKNQFLASMSQEIRSPLGVIIGFAELLQDPLISPEDMLASLKTILRNAQQLNTVFNEVLDLSRIESNMLEIENARFMMNDMIEEITYTLGPLADEKKIALRTVFEGNMPRNLCTDPRRLRQILLNVVGNAIKFTERGAVELRIKYLANEHRAEFTIVDTGIGITEAQQQKLFQFFSQGDGSMTRKYNGPGLGLAISQKLARSLGGDLFLKQSAAGHGSTFVFTVKDQTSGSSEVTKLDFKFARSGIRAVPETKVLPKTSATPNRPLESVKILLIDDSPDNRVMVGRILRSAGAQVASAENGATGIRAAMGADWDLILMDLQMPEKDGFTATEELRNLAFERPIVALTAHDLKDDRERCIQSGFSGFLSKPVDRSLLINTIKSIVANFRAAV